MMLAADLIDRLSLRVANPKTRNDTPSQEKTVLMDPHVFNIKTPLGEVAAQCGLNHDPQSLKWSSVLRPTNFE